MPRTATITKEEAKSATIQNMEKLGVYKPEFLTVIEIYAELLEQYAYITRKFTSGKNRFRYSVPTADGGEKKSPLVATLESLRKDILQYSDRLMLNPKAMQRDSIVASDAPSLGEVLKGLAGK